MPRTCGLRPKHEISYGQKMVSRQYTACVTSGQKLQESAVPSPRSPFSLLHRTSNVPIGAGGQPKSQDEMAGRGATEHEQEAQTRNKLLLPQVVRLWVCFLAQQNLAYPHSPLYLQSPNHLVSICKRRGLRDHRLQFWNCLRHIHAKIRLLHKLSIYSKAFYLNYH